MKDVRSLSDRELADYQSDYRQNAAEWKLCEQEFIRRQGMPAAERARVAIWISIGALLLSALSTFLSIYYK